MRKWLWTTLAGLLLASTAPAQTPAWQFRWQAGQVLTYRVEHVMSAVETAKDGKEETSQKLNLVKRWQVLSVDPAGVATVQKSLVSLRIEKTTPGGVLLFDSGNLDRSNPQMRDQLSKFVGQPLEVLCVDTKGKVVEVKESKYGPASRFESELPFIITLPNDAPTVGGTWERAYAITMEPPQGVGEKFSAVQKYVCTKAQATSGDVTIGLTTSLQNPPEAAGDRIPLLPLMPRGEVVFDVKAGRVQSANLKIEEELKDYQGEGTNYQFKSSYSEEYVGNP
jgi:hypothetical protein